MKNLKNGFSLIELSIVVLIIGIIIAGVAQASRLVRVSKLSSARTLTQSSPVAGISDLVAWWETTLEKSISSAEANDGEAVSTWFDVNSQSTVQNNAIQATSANQPLYKTGMINDLPALKFDGASDYFEAAYNSVLNPDKITIFAVARVSSVATYGTIVSSRNTPPNAGYMVYAAPNTPVDYEVWFGDGVASWGVGIPQSVIALDKAVILSSTNNGTNTSLYKNGTLVGSAAAAMAKNTSKPLRIGGGRNENLVPDFFFNGYIGEIIIFSRVLTAEERKAVEGYLGKKWNIMVS